MRRLSGILALVTAVSSAHLQLPVRELTSAALAPRLRDTLRTSDSDTPWRGLEVIVFAEIDNQRPRWRVSVDSLEGDEVLTEAALAGVAEYVEREVVPPLFRALWGAPLDAPPDATGAVPSTVNTGVSHFKKFRG